MNNDRRSVVWQISGLFAAALVARFGMLIIHPFDGLYGQDAFAYYDYSIALRQALALGYSLPPFFWPIGFPLHLVLAFSVVGVQPIAVQLISIIAGASIAPLTYLVTREALIDLDPARAQLAGLVAGSIMIVAGQLMISSLSIMADAAALMWATLSAWLLLRYVRQQRSVDLAFAVATLSIAILCRWAYALLIVPWAITVLVVWREHWPSIRLKRAVALTLIALCISGSLIGGQLLLNPSHAGDLQVYSWDPLNAVRNQVSNSDGSFQFVLPMALFYAKPLIDPNYVFPVLLPILIAGLAVLRRLERSTQALLILWPLIQFVFLAGVTWQNPRFVLAYFPPLVVWVGLGFDRLWIQQPSWRRGLLGLIAISWIGATIWSVRVVGNFVAAKTLDLDRVQHVADQLPNGSTVLTFGLTATLQHYSAFNTVELFNETPTTLKSRICGQTDVYAYLDVNNIDRQWTGLAPETNYRWLIDHSGLEMIDQYQGYSLFKMGEQCR